ncbi:MAG: prolyl oligopeptidase family serine peptidase [Deltaproteobacteria bacterium]|nr:prolyl oligopeptidase family serine peptidase [Deltaproteobacteria bacterium]
MPTSEKGGPDPEFPALFGRTRGFLLGLPVRAQATADGSKVLFLRSEGTSSSHDLFEFDVMTRSTRCVIRAVDLGAPDILTDAEKAQRERKRITDTGFVEFLVTSDGQTIVAPLGGKVYAIDRVSGRSRSLLPDGLQGDGFQLSPSSDAVAFVANHNVWTLRLDSPDALPVAQTIGGNSDCFFGRAEFIAQEEMARFSGFWFSPDGTQLLVSRVDERQVEVFSVGDPANPAKPPATFRYPRPGCANAKVDLFLISVSDTGAVPAVPVSWPNEQFPYLARVNWGSAHASPVILVQTRDQREAAIFTVDSRTGETLLVFTERDAAWVNLHPGIPRVLPDGSGFLWITDAGETQSLQVRGMDGVLRFEFGAASLAPSEQVLSLVGVQPGGARAFVTVGDALRSRVLDIPLHDGQPEARSVIDDGGEHATASVAGGRMFIDLRTAHDEHPRLQLHDQEGAVMVLPSRALVPSFRAIPELVQVGDSGFHAAILRPRDFNAKNKYPTVLHVYGGPHALMVRADERFYLMDQWLADQGVIVVAIDNRGTPRRGRRWERSIKGALGPDALDDQVAGLQALGARFPEMDLGRVGIHGWSFGGTMAALAVMSRPDVFHVAVAGAPVVDWLDYDTHYTERYLDLPDANRSGYERSSPLFYAPSLVRPLLLIHGTADDNVYFSHSCKLASALTRAGRAFDFLPLPGVTHQIGDPLLRQRVAERTATFLLSHLR